PAGRDREGTPRARGRDRRTGVRRVRRGGDRRSGARTAVAGAAWAGGPRPGRGDRRCAGRVPVPPRRRVDEGRAHALAGAGGGRAGRRRGRGRGPGVTLLASLTSGARRGQLVHSRSRSNVPRGT